LNHLGSPIRLGSTAARADDIECLDWNKRVSNILVTGSSGGFVTVWDMKTKKESLTLNNHGRKAASAIAWDPTKPTRLITAVPLEQEPVILVWDLRNSNAPEKILKGHDSGVLSLSWCPQDNDLLLSCGKDNRTILWNPQTGQPYGDYPVVTNWTFQTRWNPHNPNMFATASFDGKVQVQTIQNTNPGTSQQTEQSQAADGEDFFSRAPNQPQASSFSLLQAPKWLERPCSVSFGFGGRLITVRPADGRKSKIDISKFEVDSSVGNATKTFEEAIGSGNLTALCKERAAAAKTDEEKADWSVIESLVSQNPRAELVKYLGFKDDAGEIVQTPAAFGPDGDDEEADSKTTVNGVNRSHKRFQSIFASSADGDFLSELAATKGTKTNNPFQIYTGSESSADRQITRALTLGQFEKALDVCLQADRMSDAFMIAICGGEACIKKAQEAYFAKQNGGPNYLRLLASVVGKNLWDTVHNADLANWKEVMATLCTFADEKEFPDLCEALGDRLEEQMSTSSSARKDASFCYLAGSKLEKVVAIWIQELKEHEDAGATEADASSAYSLHARGLQDLIEKVTIFRNVVNFRDTELSKGGEWKLEQLYSKYLEYADVVAGHGQLNVAQRYLDMLPQSYPGSDVARTRIEQATKKKPTVAAASQQAQATTPIKTRQQTRQPGYPAPQDMFSPGAAQPPKLYNAPVQQPSNPYAPQVAAAASNPYAPPQQMQMRPPPQQAYGIPQAQPIAPPPRAYNQSPAIAPPSQAKNMSSWNDVPDDFAKQPSSRRSTPAPAQPPVASPFGQPLMGQNAPPAMAPPMGSRSRASPVPPPPKAGAGPPPRVTSPLAGQQAGERPPSSSANMYAPTNITSPPPIGQNIIPPPVNRTSSPYNAPPAGAPPPNRYAPAPGTQPSQPVAPPSRPNIAPPPQGSSFAAPSGPTNPYAPTAPPPQNRSTSYAPPQTPQQQSAVPLPPPPQQQFSAGPPPSSGPPQSQAAPVASPEKKAPPPARKFRKSPLPSPCPS
jgi:protein transport protein SEC31